MNWTSVKNFIGGAAPTLGAALGGPGGVAVGKLISLAMGTSEKPEDVMEALKSNPDALLKMKQLEMQHETELQKMILVSELENRKVTVDNVKNARARSVKLELAGHHTYRADIMLTLAFGCLCYLIYMINAGEAHNPQVLAIMNMSVGALLKMIGDGFQFEFGSSRGSKEKDESNRK